MAKKEKTKEELIEKIKFLEGRIRELEEWKFERKETESALRESENKYRVLIKTLPQKIFHKDRNSVYVSCNESYARDLKIRAGEIFGKTDYDFYPKEFAEKYRADDKRIMESGKIEDIEEKYIRDGEESIVYTVKTPVRDERGNIVGILGIFWDITERKKADEALRESENRLQSVLETIQEGVTLSDETGYFYVYNLAMEKLTGYSMEEANTCSDFTRLLYPRPEDRQRAFEGIAELLERGTSREAEMTILTKNGQSKCILVWSSLTLYKGHKMFLSVYRDITERKQAEDKIRQAAEEWRVTFDSIVDLVSIHDKEFKIMMVNKAFADVFKMEYQEIIGKTCYELIHRSKEPHFCCPYKQVMQTKKASLAEFFEPQLGFYLEVSCSPIFNEKGEVIGTVHIAKDITLRKDMEKRERLAQLGGLVADMAHEVSNPLMIISGNAQLSLMEEIQNETVKNNLKVIFEECRRAKDIIQRLLKFSRPSKGELKEIDINVILDAVMSIVEHQFKLVGIEIKRNYARDLPFIKVDEQQIQEVFMNLLNNANEAMPEGGVIEVATSCENDFLRIDLKDTGCGMSEEVMKRIIEPFFTTKEKGTGLGLSVCYGIIKAHNGELKFGSEPGKGTTATILLPLRGIDNV
jgi:PAS domain S-box-containing protein